MTIEIKPINEKQTWEAFLLQQDNPPFLQSWNAAEQAEVLGDKTLRLGVFDSDQLVGVCLCLLTRAKRGSYIFAPYGPVMDPFKEDYLVALTEYLKQWGRENKFDFIRIAPYIERNDANFAMFKEHGYRTAPIHMLSEVVWYLDLSPSEEDLLMNMRKTTRNLIRRAKKDRVRIEQSTGQAAVDKFIELMKETHQRHHFVPYSNRLYAEQVRSFKDDNQAIVFLGSYQGVLIASSIIMYYGKTASYHHGASIRSKVPVACLLQWEAILEARRRGCTEYSFWGIVETDDPKHPFYGITAFKKGFGGDVRYLLPCQDLPLSKKYYLNYIVESVRRIKRGFGVRRS